MPEKVFTEDGQEKEVPTAEELEELQQSKEEKDKIEEEKKSIEEKFESTKEELSKLQNKDFNFKKLRDMNEEEKAKLTEAEKKMKEQQDKLDEQYEQLEKQQQQFTGQIIDSYKNEALMALVGDDEDTKKQVLQNYDRIKDEAVTKDQVYQKVREAYNMTGNSAPQFNPFQFANSGLQGTPPKGESKKGGDVDKDLASKLQISEDDLNNYNQ